MPVIGLDLGGTKLSGAVFSSDGGILEKQTAHLLKREGAAVSELIQSVLRSLMDYAGKNNIKIESVGICIPGISWSKKGTVWAPNIPGWEDYPLLADIRSVLPDENIIVSIDSDRACSILGEVWQGAAKGESDAVFLAVGTGIGAGIISDGHVIRGSNDIAGAIGWLALSRPFEEKYIQCGCFEYYASGEGIARTARELLARDNSYGGVLKNKPADDISAYDVFKAYDDGDALAAETINIAVQYWGMTVANLVSLFNPSRIIFGGGVFGPAIKFLDSIYNEALKWAQPISIKQVTLSASALGGDAVLIGAGYLALKALDNKN